MNPYELEKLELWASDFAESTAASTLPPAAKGAAGAVALEFLKRAGTEPDSRKVTEAVLDIPATGVHEHVPEIVARLLESLEETGRVGGGRELAQAARALAPGFREGYRPEPVVRGASTAGRNDPCPCGSGKKYKKCCLK